MKKETYNALENLNEMVTDYMCGEDIEGNEILDELWAIHDECWDDLPKEIQFAFCVCVLYSADNESIEDLSGVLGEFFDD